MKSSGYVNSKSPVRAAAPAVPAETLHGGPAGSGRAAFPFKAEIDLTELDGRGRPGPGWSGKSCEISRGHIVFRSRRLCYEDREIVVAVHLIDDRPAPLFGRVTRCEYDGDGLYRTTLNLAPLPQAESIKAWLASLLPRS
ncbi:MAG TPA: hypothetical protein VHC70_04310 [Phycisphaerales bacterium]|jgi:hypothetical protein|nr:hypothetical protein [Phycisphaerales bacterium]